MTDTRRSISGIALHGRIYLASESKVYAFDVLVLPIVPSSLSIHANGAFQFSFAKLPGVSTAFGST